MPPRPDNAARTHRPRGPSGAARGCAALLYPENRLIFRMILTHYLLETDFQPGERDPRMSKQFVAQPGIFSCSLTLALDPNLTQARTGNAPGTSVVVEHSSRVELRNLADWHKMGDGY